MINIRFVINLIGKLLLIESVCFLICTFIALFYGESDADAFLYSAIITTAISILIWTFVKAKEKVLARKDGYFIVTMVWIAFSLFGCLPYLFAGTIPSFIDAFFETMSGFTTTGATILDQIEALPHATLFWRSLTQWLGGLGIAVLFLAILPSLGIEGRDLYMAEVTGPTHHKMASTFYNTSRILWLFYLLLTVVAAILLFFGGMEPFDAICHSFTTLATGGFSTKQASIAHWDSPFIHYVIAIFMVIASSNLVLCYAAFTGKAKKIIKDEEFRWYMLLIFGATLIITTGLYISGWGGLEKSFRDAFFQVTSIISSSGFASVDYLLWPGLLSAILLLYMFIGGCAGSTAGGMKVVRIGLLFKNSFDEMKRIIHPNAVINVRYNNKTVHPNIMSGVSAFFILYIIMFFMGSIVMSLFTNDFATACSSVVTSLSNIGPGFGSVGPTNSYSHLPDFAKMFLAFLMLIGRLEIYTVIVLFTKTFWRK
ncbi:TrkH family potassium uptake protein [Odoribacter sp. OttesenSCG-928-A06]|nr:TrkH family potassium uptake protein [Odoribacter sp. OttesenSCG-928-A06]